MRPQCGNTHASRVVRQEFLRRAAARPILSGMSHLAHLPGRGLVEISGEDRIGFLQGLVSNDVAEAAPGRKAPNNPVPIFTMTVRESRVAYVQFSGARGKSNLTADEVRLLPIDDDRN